MCLYNWEDVLKSKIKIVKLSLLKVAENMKFRNKSMTMLFATIMTIDIFFLQIVTKAWISHSLN